MAEEIWKPIPSAPGYEASSHGRSLDRMVPCGRGAFRSSLGRVLRPGKASNCYPTVALGKGNTRTVHSVVMEAFVGLPPPGCEVRHKDADRNNPRLDNLHYGTRTQNIQDAIAHGGWWSEARLKAGQKGKETRLSRHGDNTYNDTWEKNKSLMVERYGTDYQAKIGKKAVRTKNRRYGKEWGALGFAGVAYSKQQYDL